MATTGGRSALDREVAQYGRKLVRDGWVQLESDRFGNLRFSWPRDTDGPDPVLTLARGGIDRNKYDRLTAEITGNRNRRTTGGGARTVLRAVQDGDDIAAELARHEHAARNRASEQRRRQLIAVERRYNYISRLMSAPPGR